MPLPCLTRNLLSNAEIFRNHQGIPKTGKTKVKVARLDEVKASQ